MLLSRCFSLSGSTRSSIVAVAVTCDASSARRGRAVLRLDDQSEEARFSLPSDASSASVTADWIDDALKSNWLTNTETSLSSLLAGIAAGAAAVRFAPPAQPQ